MLNIETPKGTTGAGAIACPVIDGWVEGAAGWIASGSDVGIGGRYEVIEMQLLSSVTFDPVPHVPIFVQSLVCFPLMHSVQALQSNFSVHPDPVTPLPVAAAVARAVPKIPQLLKWVVLAQT